MGAGVVYNPGIAIFYWVRFDESILVLFAVAAREDDKNDSSTDNRR